MRPTSFIACLLLHLLFMGNLYAQQTTAKVSPYKKGDHTFHIGIGYPSIVSGTIATFNALPDFLTQTFATGKGKAPPQIALSYDYGFSEDLSLGPYFGYATATTPSFNWNTPELPPIPIILPNGLEARDGSYFYKINITSLGGRGVYHFHVHPKIDVYAVGIIGVNIFTIKEQGALPDATLEKLVEIPLPEIAYTGKIGGQLYFTENIGMYLELGYGMNVINTGLTIKFDKKEKYIDDEVSIK